MSSNRILERLLFGPEAAISRTEIHIRQAADDSLRGRHATQVAGADLIRVQRLIDRGAHQLHEVVATNVIEHIAAASKSASGLAIPLSMEKRIHRICSRPAGLALTVAMPRKHLSKSLRKREDLKGKRN